MRTMAEKGLLLAFGAALLVLSPAADGIGTVDGSAPWQAVPVAGLLAAISVAGLVEWLMRGPWAWIPPLCFVIAAALLPSWAVMLPPVAYDAARAGRPGAAAVSRFVPWLWIAPLFRVIRPGGPWDATAGTTDAALPALSLAAATLMAFMLGMRSARESALTRLVRRMTDRARESDRSVRVRLADVDEERAQSVRMATLGERTRIAREIHDNVGHLLTRAIMQSQAGRAVAEATGDETSARAFAAMDSTLNDAMTMVRRSVHDLEDDGTDFAAQIDDAVRSFDGVSPGFAVHLGNDVDSAPAPVARCLATVIRESLTNVVRHSAAREATVTLRGFPAFWQLVVQDPGPALPAATRRDPTDLHGMGLADIESRVRALGGTSSCGPYDGGWRVFVSVPKAGWRRGGGTDRPGSSEASKAAGTPPASMAPDTGTTSEGAME